MGVASDVFAGLETAAKNRIHPNCVKIIRGYDAASEALGTIAEAERRAHDFVHDEGVDQRATLLQIEDVGPGNAGRAGLATSGSGERDKLFLVSYERVRTEEDSFDPTENGGVGADS